MMWKTTQTNWRKDCNGQPEVTQTLEFVQLDGSQSVQQETSTRRKTVSLENQCQNKGKKECEEPLESQQLGVKF